MRMLGALFSAFCMATVLALMIGLGYLLAAGALDRPKLAQLLAVFHGLPLAAAPSVEPTTETAVTARPASLRGERRSDELVLRSQQLDQRERFIEGQRAALEVQRRKITEEVDRLAATRDSFQKQRAAWESGERAQGVDEAVLLISKLATDQAKEQILLYLKKGETDWVVSLMRKLPADRQAKIANEFTLPEEKQRLNEIIARIRDGEPPLPSKTP